MWYRKGLGHQVNNEQSLYYNKGELFVVHTDFLQILDLYVEKIQSITDVC